MVIVGVKAWEDRILGICGTCTLIIKWLAFKKLLKDTDTYTISCNISAYGLHIITYRS